MKSLKSVVFPLKCVDINYKRSVNDVDVDVDLADSGDDGFVDCRLVVRLVGL